MVFEEEGDCIVCLEIRADELIRRLISGELTNYSVVRTSPEPLQFSLLDNAAKCEKTSDLLVIAKLKALILLYYHPTGAGFQQVVFLEGIHHFFDSCRCWQHAQGLVLRVVSWRRHGATGT
jgi:hypothetical protein